MSFFGILFLLVSLFAHDLHLSLCDVYFNKEYERLEIEQRIFIDDLENSLKKSIADPSFNILEDQPEKWNRDSLFISYLNEHNQITVNEKSIALKLLDFEHNEEAFTFYLYADHIPEINSFSIFSGVLFDLFDDQMNVVSLHINGVKKSGRFRQNSKAITISF